MRSRCLRGNFPPQGSKTCQSAFCQSPRQHQTKNQAAKTVAVRRSGPSARPCHPAVPGSGAVLRMAATFPVWGLVLQGVGQFFLAENCVCPISSGGCLRVGGHKVMASVSS